MTNPLFEDIDERVEGVGDERVAYCTVIRKGQSAKTSSFSVEDAKQAGLWDDRPTVKRKMKYDGWYQGKKVTAGRVGRTAQRRPLVQISEPHVADAGARVPAA